MTTKRKSKVSFFLTIIIICVLLFNITTIIYATTDATGELGTSGLTWTYTGEDRTLVISIGSGDGIMPNYTTSVSKRPEFQGKLFTNIVIEEGITNVGEYAFYNNTNIVSVILPEGINIGFNAFKGTPVHSDYPSLYIVNIGKVNREDVKIEFSDTGQARIYGLGDMQDLTSSASLNSKRGSYPLTSVVVEKGVTNVGRYAFYETSTITSVEIANTVKIIGAYAFKGYRGDSQLTSLTGMEGVELIEVSAFEGTKITELITPSLMIIEDGAFRAGSSAGNQTLMSVNAPNLTTVGKDAFNKQTKLNTFNTQNLTSIGLNAFKDTPVHSIYPSIRKVEIGKENSSDVIAEYNDYTEQLNIYGLGDMIDFKGPDKYSTSGTNLVTNVGSYRNEYPISSVLIQEGVSNIGAYAFYTNSLSINIPDSVKKIGDGALYGVTAVTGMQGVEEIGIRVFVNGSGDSKLTTIPSTLPALKVIGDSAFSSSKITNFNAPNLVTIGSYAFSGSSLTSFTIPETVTNIGNNAFNSNRYLASLINLSKASQVIGQNILNGAGSNVPVGNREVYAYSTNENFIIAVQGYTSNPYTIITLDGKELNPLESTLEDWVQAGNSAEDWIEAGNTIVDYINGGGTANSWGDLLGGNGTYLWKRAGGTTSSWTLYGGNAVSWGSYGGSPTSWAEAGGTLGSWEEAGGDVEEYKQEVPEEDGEEDEEENKIKIDLYIDESKITFPDVQPRVVNEKILAPLRFIWENLGATVEWLENTKQIYIKKEESNNKIEIVLTLNQASMLVNGKSYPLEVAPIIENGRTLLPTSEITKAYQTVWYKQEKPTPTIYEGYYSSEEIAGAESKLRDIPVIEEFTDNPNLIPLTPENEENILNDEISMTDILLTAEPTNFRATVPFKVEIHMDKYGVITIGQGYKITNECPLGQIIIVDFKITPVGGWNLVDISENFKTKKINTKEFGLSANDSTALNNSVPLNTSLAEPIRNRESKDLVFDVKIPGQTAEVNQVISSLSIVLDFWK